MRKRYETPGVSRKNPVYPEIQKILIQTAAGEKL
jgi:hypothetical protein